jgi:uncharacterized membrane protein
LSPLLDIPLPGTGAWTKGHGSLLVDMPTMCRQRILYRHVPIISSHSHTLAGKAGGLGSL